MTRRFFCSHFSKPTEIGRNLSELFENENKFDPGIYKTKCQEIKDLFISFINRIRILWHRPIISK